ncbi:MAG: DNA polymerase III subunit beta [Oscillospiraceae bacterium]|nr:DNA polymerase III subunit beta [Oscillospiraceae bacterium]
MKIKCERGLLLTALSTAARAVSARSTLPALEGVLLWAEEDVSITGYNMETGITAAVSEAEIIERGGVILPARILVDIVRKMPDGTLTLSVGDGLMTGIECGSARFRVMGMPPEQFPKLPEFNRETCVALEQKLLKSMLGGTLYAVSTGENKTVHTGALFDIGGGVLNVVALDGFRLAMRAQAVETGIGDVKFVAPGQALREVEHILTDEGEVNIIIGGRHIMFELNGFTVLSRLLDGEFLDYKKAVPESQPISLTADARALLECIERVSLLVSEKIKNPVKLTCGDGAINLSLNTPLGSASDLCDCEGSGGDMEIGFNHRYLIDALRASVQGGCENITMKFSSPLSPCVMEPDTEGYRCMVLPVRLKAE